MQSIENGKVTKLIRVQKEKVIVQVWEGEKVLNVQYMEVDDARSESNLATDIKQYVLNWFDMGRSLAPFYELAKEDKILAPLAERYGGLRIIGIEDMFEALCWAIIGQQVNLTFAYQIKNAMVQRFGDSVNYDGESYFLFPSPSKVAKLTIEELYKIKFSRRKAEYVIGLARLFVEGKIFPKEKLKAMELADVKGHFTSIRGIGDWTADYVAMRCLKNTHALPLTDVGIHNALKACLGLDAKPPVDQVRQIFAKWKGWEAYATLYLWRSLIDNRIGL